MTICIVSSSGGHLVKTFFLKKWWQKYERFWVTKKDILSDSLLKEENVLYCYFPETQHVFNSVRNFFLALYYLQKNKPTIIFSMGAGVAPPFFLAAKMLGIQSIFIETFIFRNKPTLSARIIYTLRLSDVFYVQNKKLLHYFPNARYAGTVILGTT